MKINHHETAIAVASDIETYEGRSPEGCKLREHLLEEVPPRELPQELFERVDNTEDAAFYRVPRMVAQAIDVLAREKIAA